MSQWKLNVFGLPQIDHDLDDSPLAQLGVLCLNHELQGHQEQKGDRGASVAVILAALIILSELIHV